MTTLRCWWYEVYPELRLFFRFLKLPNSRVDVLQKVNNGKIWMMPYHTRTCAAHNNPDLFPHLMLVAVDRALRACGFVRSPPAVVDTLKWVIQQRCTWITQPAAMGVIAAAVQIDHCCDRPFFKFNCMICVEYAHVKIFFIYFVKSRPDTGESDQIKRRLYMSRKDKNIK